MSAGSQQNPTSADGQQTDVKSSLAILLGLLGAGALAWFIATKPPPLDRSVIGLGAIVPYLASRGVEADLHNQVVAFDKSGTGLRILPLYDANPFVNSRFAKNDVDDEFQPTQRDISIRQLSVKLREAETLLVLPKWRAGVWSRAKLHPDYLVGANNITLPLQRGGVMRAPQLQVSDPAWQDLYIGLVDGHVKGLSGLSGTVQLYAAQTLNAQSLSGSGCTPHVMAGDGALLARCTFTPQETPFWLLSDPDIINNFGASRGDNAALALALIRGLAGEGKVVLDTTTRTIGGQKSDEHKRSFADLLRFFEPPFTTYWVLLAVLFALILWHAWVRFGAARGDDADAGLEASKEAQINANRSLLLASGSHRTLVKRYVDGRLALLAGDLFGQRKGMVRLREEHLMGMVRSRNPQLARRLADQTSALRTLANSRQSGVPAPSGGVDASLKAFEQTIKEITDDFGRSAPTGR